MIQWSLTVTNVVHELLPLHCYPFIDVFMRSNLMGYFGTQGGSRPTRQISIVYIVWSMRTFPRAMDLPFGKCAHKSFTGCVRLASLGHPRCVAVFFFRTNVGNYLHTFVLGKKPATNRGRPGEANRTHPYKNYVYDAN